MLFAGISTIEGNAAVALFNDRQGQPIAAVEEPKINRRYEESGFPLRALEVLLAECEASVSDIAGIGFASAAGTAPSGLVVPASLNKAPSRTFPVAEAHAAGAFYSSGFEDALVIAVDSGTLTGLVATGHGAALTTVAALPDANSLDWLDALAAELAVIRVRIDDCRLAWLAAIGEAASSGVPSPDQQLAAVARRIQSQLEDHLIELARHFRGQTSASRLCLSGTVFQNPLLVRVLEQRAGFDRVSVQPVPGSAGAAIGAGHLTRAALTGFSARAETGGVLLGPGYGPEAIKAILDNCKLIYEFHPAEDQLLQAAVRLLGAGKILGWHQGRTEFGQRALGNRSILASPFAPFVKENLNHFVKHRPVYHPFALSIPEADAPRFVHASDNCRHAGSVGTLRPDVTTLDAFSFGQRLARVHVVRDADNLRFARLLRRFGQSAPAPVLINASFNLFGEPLVSDPRDAIRTFYCSGIDALVLGDFLVQKS